MPTITSNICAYSILYKCTLYIYCITYYVHCTVYTKLYSNVSSSTTGCLLLRGDCGETGNMVCIIYYTHSKHPPHSQTLCSEVSDYPKTICTVYCTYMGLVFRLDQPLKLKGTVAREKLFN